MRDGQEALDYLFQRGAWQGRVSSPPSLILLDLNLPRVGGHEVLNRIRKDERTRLLPVVVLTSSIEERDVRGAYTGGANGYVRKCVDYAEFCDSVGKLTDYWLGVNQAPPRAAHGSD